MADVGFRDAERATKPACLDTPIKGNRNAFLVLTNKNTGALVFENAGCFFRGTGVARRDG